MTFGQRIEQNMRAIAATGTQQMVVGTVVVIAVLGLMTVVGIVTLPALIGGTIGYLSVQAYARMRYRD
ncbi:MAG: hypothetical protein QOG62_2618 [Thermoleophilaceae bacterium]|jgi:hypothetical protein|nr:hypothetical protein [Thermoleophilaceae bacterium]